MASDYKETMILFNNKSNKANIYTCDPVIQSELLSLCEKYPNDYRFVIGDSMGKNFEVTKNLIGLVKGS